MPIVKRINKYQGLKDIDVLIEDTGVSSKYFQIYDFPSQLPQGKSSFLIAGSPFLKDNVELRIEIVDSAGNTVYTEPVPGYLEGRARRVSIEIYDDVEPGDGKMYIVGELKPNYKSYSAISENQDEVTGNIGITNEFIDSSMGSNDVPSEYQGVYNVRYERDILINTKLPNSQPVFFYKQPSITAVEIVKPFIENSAPPADVVITGSIKVDPNPDIETPIILPAPPEPSPLPMPDVVDISKIGQFIERFKSSRKAKINPFQNQSFFARGRAQRRSSPEVDRFSIEIESMEQGSENDGDKASGAMIGGTITINSPVVDTTRYPSSKFTIPTSYVSKVKKVKNNKILIPEDDFLITDKFTKERIPVKIITDTTGGGGTGGNSAAVTMSYSPTPTASLSTTHFRSFAKITTSGLRTFSGDVFKAKVFAKSQGALGEFEPYWEGPIESPQLLTDPFSDTGFVNVGYFHKKDVFEEHWVSGSNTTITRDDEKIIDAIQISGSNYTDGSNLTFTTSGSVELETNVPYTLQFNSYFYKELAEDKEGNDVTDFDCEIQVCKAALYDGGSVDEYQTLGKLDIDNFKSDAQGELSEVITTFVSPSSGDPKLKVRFKVNRGRLILSDVVARPYSETNFNPDFFQCIIPLPYPLPKRPDKYDFLVEFYDINNNLAETFALLEGVDFIGPNPVIADGLDALFSGSMLIGESMEMYGVNPAYLRTVGYRGFKHSIDNNLGGFLMFSGSIDSRISASEESGNEYNGGVGLEVVDGGGDIDRYMRFRTQPSIFEVVTDTFFLGRENLSFISGSLGNIEIFSSGTTTLTGSAVNILTPNFYFGGDEAFISGSGGELEISSSNFHLSSSGDVTMAGTITANAGSIGGFDITSDSLSSTNFFLSGSATGNEGKDDTNLFISSSGFAVTADGDLTGSKVLLTGGKIAGWTIEGTTLVGANATLDGQGSALFRTDAGPGSDSSAAFDQLRDEYYIDFTPTEGPTNSAGQFYVKFGPNFSIDNEGILFASGAKFAGTITASAGLIGGFQIGSSSLFAGTNEAAPNFFISGAAAGTDFTKSNLFISASGFQVNSQGVISASAGNIANFTIDNHSLTTTGVEINDSTQDLFISSSAFKVKHDGTISGSEVLFTGGKIGGFSITDTAISSSRLVMSDVGGNDTRIQVFRDSGNTEVIRLGEISDDSSDKHGLKLFDTDGTTEIVRLGQIGNKIGGWEITDSQIRTIPDSGFGGLYAEAETGLIIKSSGTLETSDFATGLKGWRISSEGNGTAEFENARIRGTLRTAVFEKESVNVVGGQLMIANSTTTQPLRNSSGSLVLSTGPAASSSIGVAEVTMSMANVTGFTSGSIIKAKKVDDTGFAVEYLHVEGSQRFTEAGSPVSASLSTARTNGFMDAVDPDGLAGFVFVSRGYGGAVAVSSSLSITNSGALNSSATQFNVSDASSLNLQDIIKIDDERMKVTKINSNTIDVVRDYHDTTAASHDTGTTIFRVDSDKEFLSGLVSTAQTYNEGQVFVDTGKFVPEDDISSGYILQNANPNDISTPYMDIVERTGSGVYDLQLRTRIGDLSGLSSAYLFGDEEPGFGIYTEKGFFKGSITADTGSFAGIVHIATVAGGLETGQKISMGRDVNGTLDGFHLNDNNYWYTTGEFRLGDSTNFLHISGTEASVASDIDIKTDKFKLDTANLDIDSAAGGSGSIALGATPPTAYNSGTGFFVDGSGRFLLGNTANNHISWNGTNLTLVGTIRQTLAGDTIVDYVDKGTWSGSSTSYNVNDLVQYSGSTYKCIGAHTSTNDTNTTTGRPDTATNSWAVYAAGGSAGSNAKTISVSSNSLVFVKAQDGTLSPSSVTITANGQNLTQAGAFSTTAGTLTSKTENTSGGSATVTSGNFVDGMVVTYTTHGDDGSLTDSVTLKELDEGSGTIAAILSNEAHVLPASTTGAVSSYSDSGTTIKVFEGATALTFTTSTPGSGEFAVSVGNTANITEGAVSGNGTNTCTIADHSGAADGTDEYVIVYTITGKTANGTSFTSFTKSQSLSKSKTGADGVTSKTVSLSATAQIIEYNAAGDDGSGTITLTATSQNFTDAYFKFTGGGGAFSDESSYTNGSGANSDTATFTIPGSYSATPYTFTVSVQEGSSGGEVASDTLTIASIKPGTDGADAYTVILSNESHTLPTTTSGDVTYAGSGTEIIAYKGTTQLTGVTGGGTPSAGQFTATPTDDNITVGSESASSNKLVFDVSSGCTSNTATISFAIKLESASTVITKVQSISKANQGATGETGAAGAGIAYQGEWATSTAYIGTATRKDVVKGSDNEYWIAKSSHTSGASTKPITGGSYATYWETFGATFSSVATDILFADDVYAQKTVNIGTSGGSPVIALDADDGNSHANPFIGISSSTYDANSGIYLGFDSATPKLSIKNSDGSKYFRWTGAALEVDAGNFTIDSSGDITATNVDLTGDITAETGAIGGWILDGTSGIYKLDSGTPGSSPNNGITIENAGGTNSKAVIRVYDGTTLNAALGNFASNKYGVYAQEGEIGGWTIGATTIAGGNTTLNSSGTITLGASANANVSGVNAGIYMDAGGDFLVFGNTTNLIRFDVSEGDLDIQSEKFELKGLTVTASADDAYIRVGSGTNRTEWTGSDGVWLSGSGEFNMQSGSQFIRNVAADGGMEMNFGNFSVNTLGNLSAESGSFRGEVRAESGFFGTQTAGWQIDSNNLRDTDSIISLTPGSGDASVTASISLTNLDGDFRAEIVPEYSSADVVLNAGGFAYANGSQTTSTTATGGSTGLVFPIGNGTTDSYTGNNIYGYYSTTTGDTAGSSFTVEKRPGAPAGSELSSGTEYKTTFKTRTSVTLDTSLYDEDNYYILGTGTATITGKFKSDSGDIQSFTHNHTLHLEEGEFVSGSTTTNLERTFTVSSHTPSSTESHWVEIDSFTVTNTNLQQYYSIGPKNYNQQLNISAATATIKEINHSPSNKITQIAPKGFQTINLGNSDLENAANTYVRTDVAGSKILDILGDSFITGSLTLKERGSTDVVTINPNATAQIVANKTIQAATLSLNGTTDQITHTTSYSGGITFEVNNAIDFLMQDGGDFHADADLVGFSSTISDIQFKENVNPIENALFKVQQLRGVEFDWKNEYSDKGHDIGFIAQEVESIKGLEPFVSEKLSLRANKSSKVVHYDKVVSLLVEAVKEQQIQLDDMKSEIEDLKNGNHD